MGVRLNVIQEQLKAQQDLSAVERFARLHEEGEVGEGPLYESQIPLSKPKAGQQYGFRVDLDACTGCKACVVGCNKLNGLDHDEAWRAVGVLHGGTAEAPVQQTVTAACHHCVDPGCMSGCPVGAYEKNPETGIVKHLDDQCIGCQYCTLTCPYEVPQYNERLGIVRKCDMCQDRLADGESPACVESCPNGAITISIVELEEIRNRAKEDAFLPKAPAPGITTPTTTYATKLDIPQNVVPANFYAIKPAHAHFPLVVMLVLTQLSIGAFLFANLLSVNTTGEDPVSGAASWARISSLVALVVGMAGLGAATLHLGRPLYAFRAFIGLRTSWMSREIIAGGVFVKVAVLFTLSLWKPDWFELVGIPQSLSTTMPTIQSVLGVLTVAMGLVAGFCSVMIYVATKKRFWSIGITGTKFLGSVVLLGLSTLTMTASAAALSDESFAPRARFLGLALAVLVVGALKLAYEASAFSRLSDDDSSELKRSARLMTESLRSLTKTRFALGVIGGVLLPGALLLSPPEANWFALFLISCFSLITLIVAEVLERTLFFKAVSSPRMPGSIGQ